MFSLFSDIFTIVFYQPLFNILMVLYKTFGGNLGLAVIGIAVLAKILTFRMTQRQLQSAKQMKEFQDKTKEVKKKFKKSKEKLNEEMMKLSAQYMPAQLGGCLPLIISIILLLQIRYVVINLVNEGYHSFNQVAYVESLKIKEDYAIFEIPDEFKNGEHELEFYVESSDGREIQKEYTFAYVDDKEEGEEFVKDQEKKFKNLSDEDKKELEEKDKVDRNTEISIFVSNFEDGEFVTDNEEKIYTYLRPPSEATN